MLARVGYAAKGVVYVFVGGLALLVVLGSRARVPGKDDAVRSIGEQPFGEFLLIASGVGLGAYVAWCVLRAALNLERESGFSGAMKRVAAAISALVYSTLALTAFQLALHEPSQHDGARPWVARAMNAPFGTVLVGLVAVAIAVHGVLQVRRGLRGDFMNDLATEGMSSAVRSSVLFLGRGGLCARGAVFEVVAYGLLRAAIAHSPGKSRDLAGALRDIALQPYGAWLLGATALGLLAYGVYTLVSSRYLRLAC
jgi:hypothetical protein